MKKYGWITAIMCGIMIIVNIGRVLAQAPYADEAGKSFATGSVMAVVIVLSAALFAGIAVCLYMGKTRGWKTEHNFLLLYLVCGIFYMLALPISSVPDEDCHFQRIYGITEGYFVADTVDGAGSGSLLPENLIANWKNSDMKLVDVAEHWENAASEKQTFHAYDNTALYSPFSYAPQVIGVFLGKLFSDRIFLIAYMGRIVSFLIIGVILFCSVKALPVGKNIAAFVALLPMNLHESVSLAADGFATAVTIAYVSYILYLRYRTEKMTGKHYAMLFLLLFFLASCKIVYVPLCVLAFLIPWEKFGSRKKYWITALCAAAFVCIVTFGWLFISSRTLSVGYADSALQIDILKNHPAEYAKILFTTLVRHAKVYCATLFGSYLGWLTIRCNRWIVFTSIALFLCVVLWEKVDFSPEGESRQKGHPVQILFAVVWLMAGFLIFTSLFVQWTPYGSDVIKGVQGRYFIPLLIPVVFSLKLRKRNWDGMGQEALAYPVYPALAVIHIWFIVTLFTNLLV